ncbi:hypothetical protein RB195_019047 [Necator americanus]|uniref:Uncharacterized protein n=1 Tax=Necator americanus TaxID=51031 RepID=A0ABR1CFZ1_NECAM
MPEFTLPQQESSLRSDPTGIKNTNAIPIQPAIINATQPSTSTYSATPTTPAIQPPMATPATPLTASDNTTGQPCNNVSS